MVDVPVGVDDVPLGVVPVVLDDRSADVATSPRVRSASDVARSRAVVDVEVLLDVELSMPPVLCDIGVLPGLPSRPVDVVPVGPVVEPPVVLPPVVEPPVVLPPVV